MRERAASNGPIGSTNVSVEDKKTLNEVSLYKV